MGPLHSRTTLRRLALWGALLLGACSPVLVQTEYDPAKATELARYRTYDWLEKPVSNESWLNNPIMRDVVHAAVERQLAARGMKPATDGNADVHLAWGAAVQRRLYVDTMPLYYGYSFGGWYGPMWGFGVPMTTVREYLEGTLVVDMIDAKSNELVWRGVAESDVDDTARERAEDVETAARKMFEQFPPIE